MTALNYAVLARDKALFMMHIKKAAARTTTMQNK